MCELGLHISSAGGTRGVCTCRALGGILAGCVCVCVFLHRLCVRMDQWVCVPLPLVFLESKTLTSSEKGTFHPLPIIIQLFQVSFKRGIFYADYRRNKLKHNCVRHLKILTAPRPPLLILSVWKSFLPACISPPPLLPSELIRTSVKERPPEAGRRAPTQLLYSSRLIFRQRLSNTHLSRPHSTRHNKLASCPSPRLFLHECAFITL